MPLYLFGRLVDSSEVQWSQVAHSDGQRDRTLVLKLDARLFSVSPGLRSATQGRKVDMSRLPLSVAGQEWIPRRGTFDADVRSSALTGYVITLQF